ncbi:uncharacterized protein BX663DRAFT_490207 [Cokeromyces recurvatus]|uniref:uncharacterized protein n=1 Tax=Cokeromyces recurvatus TaxID=90255 RepID=UPI0022207B44|nr:uncharacterized protein BX663DRAFT_490207 [Cokeromyces recurvatus]KAI7898201.1 hypothetical protein BX663DRAFT_490207 [Cokeromyces recurvatus]
MVSKDLSSYTYHDKCKTVYIQPSWSDHSLLITHIRFPPPTTNTSSVTSIGKGIWRANPSLALNPEFTRRLNSMLSKCVLSLDTTLSAAEKWEALKKDTAKCC